LTKKILSVLQYLVFLSLGVLLLWLVFRKLNIHTVLEEMRGANFWWLGLSMVFGIISHVFRAMRWNILIEHMGYRTKTSTTFFAVMIGYLANTAVPRLGEVTRCGVLSRKTKVPFDSLVGSVIAERIFDLFVLLFLIFLVIVFQMELLGQFLDKYLLVPLEQQVGHSYGPILLIIGAVVLLGLIGFLIYRYVFPRLTKYVFFKKIYSFLQGLINGAKTIYQIRQKALFLFYTFMVWLMYTLMVYVPFYSLGETSHLDLIDGLTVMTIGSLGMVAPVPGGLGAYHFIVKAILLEIYKVPAVAAASFATLTHAAQTLMIILVGSLSYLYLFLIGKKK
jgi:uncharacterized protein (TIRG00374 family)